MNTTKNTPRFSFNIIDVILIAIMIAAAAMLTHIIIHDTAMPSDSIKQWNLSYKIKVYSIREEFQGKAGIGDTVRDAETQAILGEITEISYADVLHTAINKETGKPVVSPYPGYLSMTLTVTATAQEIDGFLAVEGFEMLNGKQISSQLPGFCATGTLISMTTTEITATPS